MTTQAQLIAALERRGYTELPGRSKKYRVYQRNPKAAFFFVGKQGALRSGKSVKDSWSVTGTGFYKELMGQEGWEIIRREQE